MPRVILGLGLLMTAFAAGEESRIAPQLADHYAETADIIHDSYSLVGKPAPDNPYDKDTNLSHYNQFYRNFQEELLFRMDDSVKGSILAHFRTGQTLGEIIHSTKGLLTWEELPDIYDYRQMYHHRGITDDAMSDEEWQSDANKVVIFYKTYPMSEGGDLHLFLNTYMATRKERAREATKPYTILNAPGSDPLLSDIYINKSYYKVSGQTFGEVWRPLGFLPGEQGSMPDVLVYYGPRGMAQNFTVYIYSWNPKYAVWEGAALWNGEGFSFFEYDGNSFEFSWNSESVNLRDIALKYEKELAELAATPNSLLHPPKENYVERSESQVSPPDPAPAPAAADSRANTADDTDLRADNASFASRMDETMAVIRDSYPAISDPAPDNPYDRETQPGQHNSYYYEAQERLLFDMDGSVKGSVLAGFREGKTLGEIIQSTQGMLTWEELPDVFNSRQMYHHRGIMDDNMSDEEWQSEANKVVIFHKTHAMGDGSALHLFQNTYMATVKENTRESTQPYTILEAPESEPILADIYVNRRIYSLAGHMSQGEAWRPLGFLPGEPGELPDVLVFYGPRGMVENFTVYLYAWNSEYAVWEGVGLWGTEGIGFFEYDGNTFDFSWDSESVNLQDTALKYEKELAELRTEPNSSLSPPEDEYVKRSEPQVSPPTPAPAPADPGANASGDTDLP